MKKFQLINLFTIILVASLTACSSGSTPTGEPEATATTEAVSGLTDPVQATTEAAELKPTFTPTPSPEPTTTNTPVPTATPPPTATATPTPEPDPVVRVNENDTKINVRSGPSTDYPVVVQFEPGQSAVVTGRNGDDSWWQVSLADGSNSETAGWVFAELVTLEGNAGEIALVEAPPLPTPDPAAVAQAEAEAASSEEDNDDEAKTPEELADELRCGKDFCVTYQDMLSIHENGGCVGNHSIYITVLQGPPPGQPIDGVVIGDTFNNVEVASGSHGPGRTEITLWNNSMSLYAKRHIDGTPFTSEESFAFTAADELIPAEVLAAKGYCEGRVDVCEIARNNNQVCRGHYSWRVTFHKFD